MTLPLRQRMAAWAAGISLAATLPASACQICLPLPTESLADRILASEHLVLAREHPEVPYSFQTVRWLKRGENDPAPVDLFLDSSTRRRLSLDDHLTILCGWDPETGEWRRLALHDETLAPVVAAILERAEGWREQPDGRLRYFAGFLGHEDPELSDLAHIEVARAPYGKLLEFADRIPREKLHDALRNYRRMEWHALYLLFLGRSEDPRDHEFIREGLADAADYGLATRVAAFATALIEIDRVDALAQLRELYGSGNDRRIEERRAILAALTVHGETGRAEFREPIIALLGDFLGAEPDLAPEIAAPLLKWKRADFAGSIATLLRESPGRFDLNATLVLRRYLRESARMAAPRPVASP